MSTECTGYDPTHPCPVEYSYQAVLDEVKRLATEVRHIGDKLDAYLLRDAEAKQEAAVQLAEHETKLTDLCGNGQPGRMRDAEEAIAALQGNRNYLYGWSAGIAAAVAVLIEFVRMRMGH